MGDPSQRTAVVTGASAGIGRAAAAMLLQDGWRVIGVGRDPERSAAAEAELRAGAGGPIDFVRGDFTEMAEVRRVAAEIAALTGRVDVLINNAGGVRNVLYRTSEGLEATFAANHLAAFVLTRELLPLLRAAAAEPSDVTRRPPGSVRVIAVSSSGHAYCPGMHWDDLNLFDDFTTAGAYCQAKLANILFTRALDRRVRGDGIVAQAMHPGVVASNFWSHGGEAMQAHIATRAADAPAVPARTLAWMADAAEAGAPGGRYFHDCAEAEMAPQARDEAAAERLWHESERILAAIERQD